MAVVAAGGLTPSKTTYTQVRDAIKAFVGSGRLLRTSVYTLVGGTQMVSVNGGAFTATGASTFTPLSSATAWDVEVVGGGGGCGGTAATSSSQIAIVGGGGSGAYARSILSALTAQTITIGAGGAAAAAGNNSGGNGGTTSFGSLITCPGGSASAGSSAVATTTPSINPGATVSSAPTGGNVLSMAGAPGQHSIFVANTASPVGGSGGSNPLGTGGGYGLSATPKPGQGFGSGAGGSAAQQSAAAAAGAAGAPGAIIVREYS